MPDLKTQQANNSAIEMAFSAIVNWVNKYREVTGSLNELGRCDAAELGRIADDLGVPASELRTLAAKDSHSADLLYKMLAALKVDAQDLTRHEPAVMRDLERLCVSCSNKRRCQYELADGTAPEHFHDFCPNAYTIDALFEQKARAAQH